MTAESPDRMPAAANRSDLRASHADREQVIGTLKAAFAQGRLAKDEFDLRVAQTLASRTYAELAAVTADLPAGVTAAEPPKPARAPGKRPILRRPGPVMTVATVLYLSMWPVAAALPTNSEGDPMDGISLVAPATLIYVLVLISAIVWAQVLGSRQETGSGGQLRGRPGPGARGQAPRRLPSADPVGQLPAVDPDDRHTAEVARRRLPRPPLPVRGHAQVAPS